MPYTEKQRALAALLKEKTLEFGADLVGLADVDRLKNGPSERLFPRMKDHSRDRFSAQITTGLSHGSVFWEEDARTAVVFAVAHPRNRPEMDWWQGGNDPPGNQRLVQVSRKLAAFLEEAAPSVSVYPKRYHVERGGIYLKEAAVYAGLGCIGRNNLLVTPEYGPRVRLRAVLLSEPLPSAEPMDFDPCCGCPGYCQKACPRQAFSRTIYTAQETGIEVLPARYGDYSRAACHQEMQKNESAASATEPAVRYCRLCELLCPVGNDA